MDKTRRVDSPKYLSLVLSSLKIFKGSLLIIITLKLDLMCGQNSNCLQMENKQVSHLAYRKSRSKKKNMTMLFITSHINDITDAINDIDDINKDIKEKKQL